MTREEQIDWLCRLRGELEITPAPKEWKDNCKQALSDAIKALQQEPCDAISRQAAIDALVKRTHLAWERLKIIYPMLDVFEELPPVTPQLKTGHWISGHKETGALGITYTEKVCSNCGWSHSLVIPKNYCPNCGAIMFEPQESEDKE